MKRLNKKAALIFIVVLVGVIGFFILQRQQVQLSESNSQVNQANTESVNPAKSEPTEISAEQVSNQTVVDYTESGFTPSEVRIKVGQTVAWTNNSEKKMWVASSPHPAHTDYPEFDQLKGVGKGEIYTFRFDKVGSWKYHNHLNPNDRGTVIVEE